MLRAGARRPAPDGGAEPGAGRGADARLGRALAAWLGRGRALRHSPASAVSGRGPKRLRRSQPRPSSLGTGGNQGMLSAFCDGRLTEGAKMGTPSTPRRSARIRGAWGLSVVTGLGNGETLSLRTRGLGKKK